MFNDFGQLTVKTYQKVYDCENWEEELYIDVLIKCHHISQSGPKHGLPFEFSVQEPPGPKSAKWAPHSLFPATGKTCI